MLCPPAPCPIFPGKGRLRSGPPFLQAWRWDGRPRPGALCQLTINRPQRALPRYLMAPVLVLGDIFYFFFFFKLENEPLGE